MNKVQWMAWTMSLATILTACGEKTAWMAKEAQIRIGGRHTCLQYKGKLTSTDCNMFKCLTECGAKSPIDGSDTLMKCSFNLNGEDVVEIAYGGIVPSPTEDGLPIIMRYEKDCRDRKGKIIQ
jgi:predicted small lipoprotein YifL